MSLRFLEGFSAYTSGAAMPINGIWTGKNDAPTVWNTSGRRSGNGLRGSYQAGLYVILDSRATWIVGRSIRVDNYPTASGGNFPNILQFEDGLGTIQVALQVRDDGTVRAVRSAGGTLAQLAVSTKVLPVAVDHYLECKVTLDNTNGVCQVRLDGEQILTFTGDTQATANATANVIRIGNSNGLAGPSGDVHTDDIYILDTAGAAPWNDFLGDLHVYYFVPTGAGATTGLAVTGAAANWQAVDEVPPNDATDYVSAAAASGLLDTYTHAALPTGVQTVYGVAVRTYAAKTDAGAANVQPVLRSGGVDHLGTSVAVGTAYAHYRDIWQTDPATGAQWTKANADSAQPGAKVP